MGLGLGSVPAARFPFSSRSLEWHSIAQVPSWLGLLCVLIDGAERGAMHCWDGIGTKRGVLGGLGCNEVALIKGLQPADWRG